MNEVRQLRQQPTMANETAAEQQLLGAILTDAGAYDRVSDILQPEHFLDPVHAKIFTIAGARISKGHLASAAAMAGIMADDDALKPLGGAQYLIRLAGSAVAASMVRDYAMLMVEYACRRRLRELTEEAGQGLAAGVDAAEVRAGLQQGLYALPEAAGAESSVSILKAMTNAVGQAAEAYQGTTSFLKTGVTALDQVLKGLAPGDVMLLGGATSMGKTSLALEIAANVALRREKPGKVGFWSLEMTAEQLATRMASAEARVEYAALRDAATMEEEDFRKWVMASQKIGEAGLRIVPRHIRDIAAGHAALRRIKREFGGQLDLAIIDYAQLVRGVGKSRFEQMTEVSIGIKALAGLLECPVIALVQLSRDIGFRDDKRPQLSDIKETGQFENDADQVVFCHREGYWLQRQGPKAGKDGSVSVEAQADFESDLARTKNLLELIVRKNRHGKLATAQVGFHEATNRFWALGHRDVEEGFE